MSPAARSVFAFGLYLALGGVSLILVPHSVCDLFGLRPQSNTLCLRVVGALLLDLGYYCVRAARDEQIQFIRWTVPPRLLTLPLLGVVVAAGWENASILVLGVIDALAALWTLLALPGRAESDHPPVVDASRSPLVVRCQSLTNSTTPTGAREQARITPQSVTVGGAVCNTAGRYGP